MKLEYRTVFLSDLHLGMRGCQAWEVARFLQRIRCEKLYLVGDIVDMWWLKRRWYWPRAHDLAMRRLVAHARRGTEIVFLPGNHDEAARDYLDLDFGNVRVRGLDIHTTADGRRLLVTHGDGYDLPCTHSRWLSRIGGHAYRYLVQVNDSFNRARRLAGLRYWSLSRRLKMRLRRACILVQQFEDMLIDEARRHGVDGVICGHIHSGAHRVEDDGIEYFNCGDWLESCTALVEHACGRLELIDGSTVMADHDRRRRARHADRRRERVIPTLPAIAPEMVPLPAPVAAPRRALAADADR